MSAPSAIPSPIHGVLVVDKPRGPTSHDVVARLRRTFRTRSVGHAGTLDPMATGVLIVAVGDATKLVPWLTAHDKTYEAEIALGIETDTLDAAGRETRRAPVSDSLRAWLRRAHAAASAEPESPIGVAEPDSPALAALARERSRTSQIPPAYSAIRSEGERAFARARKGETVDLAPRPVFVRRLHVLSARADPPSVTIGIQAGKGYYVRSLARDLADALGTVGHVTTLRRTQSGCFVLAEATPLDASADDLRARIEPLARVAARALPVVLLTDAGAREARHGRRVAPSEMHSPSDEGPYAGTGACAWLDPAGALVAVGHLDGGEGRVLRGFGGEPRPR